MHQRRNFIRLALNIFIGANIKQLFTLVNTYILLQVPGSVHWVEKWNGKETIVYGNHPTTSFGNYWMKITQTNCVSHYLLFLPCLLNRS